MTGDYFDLWTRTLALRLPRRMVWRGGVGGVVAALLARFGQPAAAARCLDEGQECKRGNQCCSGLCKKRRCRRAPGQGTCTIRNDICKIGEPEGLCGSDGGQDCECFRRPNGAAFCGSVATGDCFACDGDADCVREFGDGFVCVRSAGERCGCDGVGTACLSRCPNPD